MIGEPGSTRASPKHGWRNFKPQISDELCIRCGICWMYCPDEAIFVEKGNFVARGKTWQEAYRVNYDWCKGCGICAEECPTKAIRMVKEKR